MDPEAGAVRAVAEHAPDVPLVLQTDATHVPIAWPEVEATQTEAIGRGLVKAAEKEKLVIGSGEPPRTTMA